MKAELFATSLAALLLSACATAPAHAPQIPLLQLQPAAADRTVSLVQRLHFKKGDGTEVPGGSVDVLLEIDVASVHLAGFALGQRILTLTWNGQQLAAQRDPHLPAEADPVRILRDVELVYWPATAINAALPAGWIVSDDGQQRTLLHDGQVALTVRYTTLARWNGSAEIENPLEGYRLTIESKPQATDDTP